MIWDAQHIQHQLMLFSDHVVSVRAETMWQSAESETETETHRNSTETP